MSAAADDPPTSRSWPSPDSIGLVLGPLLMVAWLLLVDTSAPAAPVANGTNAIHENEAAVLRLPLGLTPEAHRLAGVMILTVLWWLTEPIPIPATALLAVILAVFLGAAPPSGTKGPVWTALSEFGNPALFFLLGGMFLGRGMVRHGLDRRFALRILTLPGADRSPAAILLSLGFTVAVLSMWISNTAATAMIYPITIGMISVLAAGSGLNPEKFARSPYATMLLLMTAYASSIGGVATPIGTPTNILAIGFLEQEAFYGRPVDFGRWMAVGVPIALVVFVGSLVWLQRRASSKLNMHDLRQYLQQERRALGGWNRGEKNTLFVFLTIVTLWVLPALLSPFVSADRIESYSRHFPEEAVALLAPVLLYLLPVDWARRKFTLDAEDFSKVDWGALILFGAGLALGAMMLKTGLAAALGQAAFQALGVRDVWLITAFAIVAGIVLSEFTSNSAAVSTLFPVIWGLCQAAETEPLWPLLGVTFGASFGSALPVSTPPNAIVYGSGLIPIRRMIGTGIAVDIVSAIGVWCVLRVAAMLDWTPFLTAAGQ